MYVEFKDEELIYKGIPTGIKREQVYDLQNHGIDVMNYLEDIYKNSIVIIRDVKIDLILGK